jgi:hypothetical protein
MVSSPVRLWRPLFVVLTGVVVGCSSGKGSVSGRVTLNGAPLPAGVISFHSEVGNREVCNAAVRDGGYSLDGVPTGKALVTVTSTQANPRGDTGSPASLGRAAVPARYAKPGTSGLSLTVQPGSQTFPVDLTP